MTEQTTSLQDLFNRCKEQTEDEIEAIRIFVAAAPRVSKEVTMKEVREIAGYVAKKVKGQTDEDFEKVKASIDNKWSSKILKPVKTSFLKEISPTTNPEDIFKKGKTEATKKLIQRINKRLPKVTRNTKEKTVQQYSQLADGVLSGLLGDNTNEE